MKKGVYLIAILIIFLLLFIEANAINVTETINLTENITNISAAGKITGEITGESVTGESVTGKPTQPLSMNISVARAKPTILSYYPLALVQTVSGNEALYFNINASGVGGTIPDIFWYVDNVLKDYSFSNYDEFTYTFSCGVLGNYKIKALVTDSVEPILNDSIQWNLTVSYVACAAAQAGGGVGGVGCAANWICGNWSICHNLESYLKAGILYGEGYRTVKNKCLLSNWTDKECGFQFRNCYDANNCSITQKEKLEMQECYSAVKPSCSDGIKNCHDGACEFLVDCGGPCLPCPSCSDGIQNQGEEGIDCGGPCPNPCPIEKPSVLEKLPFNYLIYILIIIGIILSTLIFVKTVRIIKLRKELKKIKWNYTLIILVFILFIIFFYFYSKFEIGDFVYKKDARNLIGEIKNKSIILKDIIQWQDDTYGEEYAFNIEKIDYLSKEEIRNILQINNRQGLSLYAWTEKGEAIAPTPIKTLGDLRNYSIRIGEEACRPVFICGGWSDCRVDYNFNNVAEGKMTSGRKYRYCKDYVECMSDLVYSENCEIKESVTIKRTRLEKRDYIELYDSKNKLVAKVTKKIVDGVEKLDIEFVV